MAFSLSTSYMGESFLSGFDWFNGTDLSNGFVSYQGREDAEAQGLYTVDEDTQVVRLGVDTTNTYGLNEGRASIRLESKETFNHGLFIADFLHMPGSHCGTWPAFWMYGDEWPQGGEIDIIEGANTAHRNLISAHTAEGCSQDESLEGMSSGNQRNTECFIGDQNIGCGFDPPTTSANTYGDGFNAANGGVYAVQWDNEYVRVWHFVRDQIPGDIRSKTPNPESWGLPQAVFGGSSCDVDSYFKNMRLVINTNFCGDFGNAVWGRTDSCSDFAPTCSEYVANNPEAFANTYWDVKYIDVYAWDDNATPVEPTTTTTMTSYSTTNLTVGGAGDAGGSGDAAFDRDASPTNPASLDGYAHLGCFGSSSNFRTFEQIDESSEMTLEACIRICTPVSFAGISGGKCLCAESIDTETRVIDSGNRDTQCSQPCPGNAQKLCGGNGDAEAGFFTVYGVVKDEGLPQPPPMAGGMPDGAHVRLLAPGKTCYKDLEAFTTPVVPDVTPLAVPEQTQLPVAVRPVTGNNSTIVMPPPVAAAMDRRGPGKLSVVAGIIVMGVMLVM